MKWNIDGNLQQQRVALHTVDYWDLKGGEGDVPYTEVEARLPLPFKESERKEGTLYVKSDSDVEMDQVGRVPTTAGAPADDGPAVAPLPPVVEDSSGR